MRLPCIPHYVVVALHMLIGHVTKSARPLESALRDTAAAAAGGPAWLLL